MGSPVLMGGMFHGAGSSQEDTIIPRLRSQDCWFILLIMFSLLHRNLWAVKMRPGEGACGKKYWHLRGSLKIVMSPVLCWLSGWMKLIEFSSVCQPCLFCLPLSDSGKGVSWNPQVQTLSWFPWQRQSTETVVAPEAQSGALTASTPAWEAASQKLHGALSQNNLECHHHRWCLY